MPTIISGNRPDRLLHRGSRHDVWLARRLQDGEPVVVKRSSGTGDPHGSEPLVREAEVLAGLAHPNVVELLGVDDDPRGPALVLAPVGGGSLRELLDERGTLAPGALVPLFEGVASAVAHLAEHGLVHGNLRPEHVLFAADGRPVVVGFGSIAELRDGSPAPGGEPSDGPGAMTTLPRPAQIADDPTYLHPRVASGGVAGHRSEVFSLGAMAYECLTGRVPHRGTCAEVIALAEAEVHRPLSSWPSVPDAVASLVEQALSPHESGPTDATEFVTRLRAVVDPAAVVHIRPRVDATRSATGAVTGETLPFGPAPPVNVGETAPPERWRVAVAAAVAVVVAAALWFLAGALLGV